MLSKINVVVVAVLFNVAGLCHAQELVFPLSTATSTPFAIDSNETVALSQ